MLNSCIRLLDRTLPGATTPTHSQNEPGSSGNEEEYLFIAIAPKFEPKVRASPSDCLRSYQDARWG